MIPDRPGCVETARRVRDGEASALEIVDDALRRIEERDDELGAFVAVDADLARERARAVDADETLRTAPLAGVPVALKDNLCLAGSTTTAASRILEGWVAPYTATAVERLLAAGAVPVGKTNMDEFAMGSSTENSARRRTVNPWNADRVPGGSSGGSAAAVAAGLVPAALGSDTGGSVRQPASFCGIAGLKPTYGRVSRYGLIAFASSLDQIGPLAADTADLALLTSVIAGPDPRDSTCLQREPPAAVVSPADPATLRVGLVESWREGWDREEVQPAVCAAVDEAAAGLERRGASLHSVALPHARYALATYFIIATAEASSNLARYDGVRYGHRTAAAETLAEMLARSRSEGFGPEVKRRILLGTYVLSAGYHDAYYGRAQRVRTLIRRDLAAAFESVDVILGPTSPCTAFGLGERVMDPLAMCLSDHYTVPANLAGLPALSLPWGTDDEGMPVGIQLQGPPLSEDLLLGVGRTLEELRS